jgi:hypothetical protein
VSVREELGLDFEHRYAGARRCVVGVCDKIAFYDECCRPLGDEGWEYCSGTNPCKVLLRCGRSLIRTGGILRVVGCILSTVIL